MSRRWRRNLEPPVRSDAERAELERRIMEAVARDAAAKRDEPPATPLSARTYDGRKNLAKITLHGR